jgi:endoglucanase
MLIQLLLLPLLALSASASFIGINLGNVLEAPTEGAWAPVAQEYYFDDYVAANFTRVRVPVRWDQHLGTSAPYTIDPVFLARVHEVVGWGLSRNLTVVINSHHDDWIDSAQNFSAQLPRFLALWAQVASSFAPTPQSQLLFEVLNEPVSLTLPQLNQLYSAVIPVMRVGNPVRPIYLGGLSWMSPSWIMQNPEAVVFPALPSGQADPNLRLEVHSYE